MQYPQLMDCLQGARSPVQHLIHIVAINVAINTDSAPAEKQHVDNLVAIVVVGMHQVDGPQADRNTHPLNGAESLVNCRLVLEELNEG
jgi:hypothetical protein